MRPPSRFPLLLVSGLVLLAALLVWNTRSKNSTRASTLLERTMRADNDLTYAATSTVTAMYGGKAVDSSARVVRAPRKLSITYLSGDRKGLNSGYNERWFWRKDEGTPMRAYAEVKLRPDEMAAHRYRLMIQNYRSYWLGEDTVNGRVADIVEVRPKTPVDGAHGPFKRLWVDRESGLSLRNDLFNYQRQPVMKTVLSKIDLNPKITAETFATPDAMMKVASKDGWTAEEMGKDVDGVARKSGIRIAAPKYLPPGFDFDAVGVHYCADWGKAKPAALARYIDGINTLTIFAVPIQAGVVKTPSGTLGACDFGPGTMVTAQKNDVQLIAVGDLPPVTLKRVLDGVDARKN